MKQSFLDSLVGMNVKDASRQCTAAGYNPQEYPYGVMRSMELKDPNTVLLWLRKDNITVSNASCDDELED